MNATYISEKDAQVVRKEDGIQDVLQIGQGQRRYVDVKRRVGALLEALANVKAHGLGYFWRQIHAPVVKKVHVEGLDDQKPQIMQIVMWAGRVVAEQAGQLRMELVCDAGLETLVVEEAYGVVDHILGELGHLFCGHGRRVHSSWGHAACGWAVRILRESKKESYLRSRIYPQSPG